MNNDFSLPLGFQWSAVKAGIKASGKPDLALALCPDGATAAAMFTQNQVVAAPIIVGRKHLAATGGKVSALVVNAGNANCATGEAGLNACLKSCIAVGDQFGCVFDEVFPSSTGIIGVPFPTEKFLAAIPAVAAALGDTREHAEAFATAILTTDTKLKIAHESFIVDGKRVNLFGCAKGAGMIAPNVGPPHATMLVYLFTDLDATSAQLRNLLASAVETSFNSISIDGDTSTNDTVLLLASGKSGVTAQGDAVPAFETALQRVCDSLAHQIIDDGEGVTHVVTLEITGARSDADAKQIARSIAHSPLCKTAWSSADPNWGRLLAAAGYAGVPLDANAITIHIGPLSVFERGMRSPLFDEAATHAHMSVREYAIHISLGQGDGRCRFLTCDLTAEYVRINADYST
ncbi:MAG: bifunctional glutamate N-acetyltransferase/amino-acid acetyltransferase ArgJ [Acidobacteriaceae bacterium]